MKFDLTVIIPNYNNEKYIEQCLNSILCQSYQPEEIIIFDDSSTDGSALILKRYEEDRRSSEDFVFPEMNNADLKNPKDVFNKVKTANKKPK